jgi:hypothetical protein
LFTYTTDLILSLSSSDLIDETAFEILSQKVFVALTLVRVFGSHIFEVTHDDVADVKLYFMNNVRKVENCLITNLTISSYAMH